MRRRRRAAVAWAPRSAPATARHPRSGRPPGTTPL